MNQKLIVLIVGLAALIVALVAGRLVEPGNTEVMQQYQAKYQELKRKPEISAAEKVELEKLFRQINSERNIKAELTDVFVRYGLGALVLLALGIIAARLSRLDQNHVLAAAGLIFLAFIVTGSVIFGAMVASAFVVTGIAFRPRQAAELPPA